MSTKSLSIDFRIGNDNIPYILHEDLPEDQKSYLESIRWENSTCSYYSDYIKWYRNWSKSKPIPIPN